MGKTDTSTAKYSTNRSIMELKLKNALFVSLVDVATNRTIMELKLHLVTSFERIKGLLIAPLWN